jgi:hypothetical protein
MHRDRIQSPFRSRIIKLAALVAIPFAAGGCGDASAAKPDPAAPAQNPSDGQAAPLAETFDLGEIVLAQLRPLENSTLHVRFLPQAVASAGSAERLAAELTRHRHQAREQVIIAARTAETWEFDEPDLHKLRRRIVLGLNRWLDAPLVEDVVLTEFRCRVD